MITINQHNYEAFFLLYVDSELSAADKQAVEQFVQANPDLAFELEMLQQAQLSMEDLVFDDKAILYRNEATEINTHNFEEQFLLYVDNELTSTGKENVERFVLQHPALQENFTILKQSRLEPETIVFADKQSLYRKEAKEKPVFYLRWQRIAVAAALIGLAVLVWTVVPQKNQSTKNLAQQKTSVKTAGGNNSDAENNTKNATNETVINNEKLAANRASLSNGVASVKTNNQQIVTENPTIETTTALATNTTTAQPVQTTRENTISGSVNVPEQTTHLQTLPIENTSISGVEVGKTANNPDENKSYFTDNAQQAVYKELDTEDDKKSLLLGSLEINKDKLRGFFRKAGSIFRGKGKTDDEKTGKEPASNTRSLK